MSSINTTPAIQNKIAGNLFFERIELKWIFPYLLLRGRMSAHVRSLTNRDDGVIVQMCLILEAARRNETSRRLDCLGFKGAAEPRRKEWPGKCVESNGVYGESEAAVAGLPPPRFGTEEFI